MNKYYFILSIGILLFSCTNDSQKKYAINHSAMIMQDLNKKDIFKYFPQDHFPPQEIRNLISSILDTCNWGTKKGGLSLVQHLQTLKSEEFRLTYDYQLNCGHLQFQFEYNINKDTPVFHYFFVRQLPIK